MSKYTEAEEHLICFLTECSMWCKENHLTETFRRAVEALQIADRLEQIDVINNEEIYIKACRRYGCWESECPHRARDRFCSDLAEIFFDGYNQALDDIRGEE